MAKMTPQEHAAVWAQRFGAAAEKYKQGVARVQENPAQLAIQAESRMVANFNQAMADGKWSGAMAKVTLAQWKQACSEKGAAALSASARLAQDKVMRAEAEIGPIRESIKSSLPARGTIEENLERSRQMALRMHEARRRG